LSKFQWFGSMCDSNKKSIGTSIVYICMVFQTSEKDFQWSYFIRNPFNVTCMQIVRSNNNGRFITNITCQNNFLVTTLALGLWPRQGHGKVWPESATHESYSHFQECKRAWGNEPTHSQGDLHFGNWTFDGIPNFQRVIWKVKIHWIEKLFISLEIFWGVYA
jgi:hypothetical protein